MREHLHRWFLSGLFVLTLVLGVLGFQRGEIFPFASWDMYARVPSVVTDFRFRVHRIGEVRFDPPRDLREIATHAGKIKSVTSLVVMRKFGFAVMGQDPEAERYRRLAEESFGLQDAEYELVQVIYNPIEMHRSGESREATIGRFGERSNEP